MTIYSLGVLLLGTSLLFHVQFYLLLPDLHTGFLGGRLGGLVFPSLSEFSTVYCDPHSQKISFWYSYNHCIYIQIFWLSRHACLHFEAKLFQMPVNLNSFSFFFLTKLSLFPLCHLLILFFFFIQISKCPKLYDFSLNSCNIVGSILVTHS